jgi:glycogen operon protein
VIALRKRHPVFRRRNFFQGRAIKGAGVKDILWLMPDGREMTDEEWGQESVRTVGVFLSGEGLEEQDERAQPIVDQNFMLMMNAHHDAVPFRLPTTASGMGWLALIDTSSQASTNASAFYEAGTIYPVQARSMVLLQERQRDRVRGRDRRDEAQP